MLRGQIDKDGHYSGIGYWGRKHYPTYIGFIRNERLEGYGIRIVHSEQKTMGILMGFWINGRIHGPGILISETGRLVGYFGSYMQNEQIDAEIIQSYEKTNNNYLKNIHITDV